MQILNTWNKSWLEDKKQSAANKSLGIENWVHLFFWKTVIPFMNVISYVEMK